jgi:hypothetical protein
MLIYSNWRIENAQGFGPGDQPGPHRAIGFPRVKNTMGFYPSKSFLKYMCWYCILFAVGKSGENSLVLSLAGDSRARCTIFIRESVFPFHSCMTFFAVYVRAWPDWYCILLDEPALSLLGQDSLSGITEHDKCGRADNE